MGFLLYLETKIFTSSAFFLHQPLIVSLARNLILPIKHNTEYKYKDSNQPHVST